MENSREKKSLYYKLLIFAAILVPILIAISYAFFLANIRGNTTTITGNAVEELSFNLVTENDGYINATNIIPINESNIESEAEKATFKVVSGNNKYGIIYRLSLTDISITQNLETTDFKWKLTCTSCQDNSKNAEGNFSTVSSADFNFKSNIFIPPNSSDEYELLVWIANTDQDQSNILNQSFSAKVTAIGDFTQYRVPLEYQEVEFIKSTGTQYIDTGFKSNQDTRVIIKAAVPEDSTISDGYRLFGARNSYTSNAFFISTTNTKMYINYNTLSYYNSGYILDNNIHIYDLDKNIFKLDGTTLKTFTYETFNTSYNAILLGGNSGGTIKTFSWILYYCQIYDNSSLIHNFIPAKNGDIVGLYDTVEQKFYTNSAPSGENLIAGPNV